MWQWERHSPVDQSSRIPSPSTYLVSGQLSDLDDLHSELHEQRLQDQALVLPVLLAHGLLPLGHAGLEDAHRRCSWCRVILLSLQNNSALRSRTSIRAFEAGGRRTTAFRLQTGRAAFKDALGFIITPHLMAQLTHFQNKWISLQVAQLTPNQMSAHMRWLHF